jgi:hypothetical protein
MDYKGPDFGAIQEIVKHHTKTPTTSIRNPHEEYRQMVANRPKQSADTTRQPTTQRQAEPDTANNGHGNQESLGLGRFAIGGRLHRWCNCGQKQ